MALISFPGRKINSPLRNISTLDRRKGWIRNGTTKTTQAMCGVVRSFLYVLVWNSGWFFDVNENLNVGLPISNSYPALKINHSQSILEDETLVRNSALYRAFLWSTLCSWKQKRHILLITHDNIVILFLFLWDDKSFAYLFHDKYQLTNHSTNVFKNKYSSESEKVHVVLCSCFNNYKNYCIQGKPNNRAESLIKCHVKCIQGVLILSLNGI